MADKSSLGILGLMLGGVTVIVTLIAGFLVAGHAEGRLVLDEARAAPMTATLTTTRSR